MASPIKITVKGTEEHREILNIQDAMRQVLDFFDLLSVSNEKHVVWNLTNAATNSPFTVEGEPIDLRTGASAFRLVEHNIAAVEMGFERILAGQDFGECLPREKLETARRIIKRTTNNLGSTLFQFRHEKQPIEISRNIAERYMAEIEEKEISLHSYLFSTTSRKEYGSVEGRIVELGSDYDEPAVQLQEQKSGRILSCRVDPQQRDELAHALKAGDVWDRRRVRIRGVLNYDDRGRIIRVFNGHISHIDEKRVAEETLKDPTFTENFTTREYLDRLREGDFG
ncbi:MAG: hypothetical protein GVY13_16995 [Alphaproteobacteria bacterium]|nr:hypothetical protein [Alphaproteobacteria bacterium]